MANKNQVSVEYGFRIFVILAVFYPLGVVIAGARWVFDSTFFVNLFPLFGVLAFVLLWLHAISGAFEPWLRRYIDFDQFVQNTSLVIFISIILHPLLLLIPLGFNFAAVFSFGPVYIWLAIIGWFLLISYDVGKILKKKYTFFVRNWNKILLISNIGFILTFFHSLGVGDNLQAGPLRIVWIFYGVTASLAIIYTYGIRRLWSF
jgi:hypothetical protein